MRAVEWLLLVGLSILWGGSFFFVEVALTGLPPLTLVVLRVGLAALALNLFVRLVGLPMPNDWRPWRDFLVMGFLNNAVPFCLIVWGQTHITGGLASILNATTPLFTVIVGHLVTADERLTSGRAIGVALGIAGVAVLIGVEALGDIGSDALPELAILGAAVSYSLAGVFGRRFRRSGIAPAVAATGQVTASTVLLAPIALAVDMPWTLALPSPIVWTAVAGLALVSTALAYLIYFRILASAGAVNLLLVTFLIPLSACALGIVILGEPVAVHHVAGLCLIGLGLAIMDERPLKRARQALGRAMLPL